MTCPNCGSESRYTRNLTYSCGYSVECRDAWHDGPPRNRDEFIALKGDNIIIGPGQVYVETEWQDADGAVLIEEEDRVVPMAHIGETRGSQPADPDSAA